MQAGFAAILTKLVQAQGVAASSNPPIFTSLLTDSDDLNKLLVLTLLRALYVSGTHEYRRASSALLPLRCSALSVLMLSTVH